MQENDILAKSELVDKLVDLMAAHRKVADRRLLMKFDRPQLESLLRRYGAYGGPFISGFG